MQVLTEKPKPTSGLVAGKSETGLKNGQWSDNNLVTQHSAPIIVNEGSDARNRFEAAFAEFRSLFPIALCYTRIVPVDEVVTLTLFYREDEALRRLMLTKAESRELDRLWDELLFVSEAPLKQVDAFEQLWQFATQDAKPSAFEPMREPILKAAERFKEQQKAAIEPQKSPPCSTSPRRPGVVRCVTGEGRTTRLYQTSIRVCRMLVRQLLTSAPRFCIAARKLRKKPAR